MRLLDASRACAVCDVFVCSAERKAERHGGGEDGSAEIFRGCGCGCSCCIEGPAVVGTTAPIPAAAVGAWRKSRSAIPSADQLAWQDLEIGMFVHFAPNTFQDKEGDDLSTPLSAINPDIDTDNWAECAVNLGARYIVFVAKHAGGFCMWQTKTTKYQHCEYTMEGRARGCAGDLVRIVQEARAAAGRLSFAAGRLLWRGRGRGLQGQEQAAGI